jgi:iron complex outermembrane receptor protein
MQVSLGYMDTEYKDLSLTNPQTGQPTDLSGNELISAPKLDFSAAIDYELFQLENGLVIAHLDTFYSDDQWYSAYNDLAGFENVSQDAYWLTNGRISYDNEQFTVAVWGKNLADTKYNGYAINLQSGFGYNYFKPAPQEPMVWMLPGAYNLSP